MSEMVTYTVRMKPICFIPDYGLAGVLVGTCKGVMMGIAPESPIIDVTHSVLKFDVIRGAETLRHATRYMPEDTVYLAVVDPGKDQDASSAFSERYDRLYTLGPERFVERGVHLGRWSASDYPRRTAWGGY
jgi:S-adenosyl-L-methionine hydrolase (adenosine-forming)